MKDYLPFTLLAKMPKQIMKLNDESALLQDRMKEKINEMQFWASHRTFIKFLRDLVAHHPLKIYSALVLIALIAWLSYISQAHQTLQLGIALSILRKSYQP